MKTALQLLKKVPGRDLLTYLPLRFLDLCANFVPQNILSMRRRTIATFFIGMGLGWGADVLRFIEKK